MLFARVDDGSRVEPSPGAHALCPQCGGEVLAKCGTLVAWHWAHKKRDCDRWSEGESEWHLGWKRQVLPSACEVVLGEHRADIYTANGLVVELQHSPLDARKIREREQFYGQMLWLFDARAFELELYPHAAHIDFEWNHPRKSLLRAECPMYFDIGSGFLMKISTLGPNPHRPGLRGRATLLDSACFASSVFASSARPEIHATARERARRVHECARLTQTILRSEPSLGLSAAFKLAVSRA